MKQDVTILKIVVLTGQDTPATCLSIAVLADLPGVEIRGVLFEAAPQDLRTRLRNLRTNLRREGLGYMPLRLRDFLEDGLNALAQRVVPRQQVRQLLQRSFPESAESLAELGKQRGFSVQRVNNLNSPEAAERLRLMDADLGIVLGTRILKRSTFTVPRMGCLNLHKGKVPEYRGMPPGFWEIYDGQLSAGVTVHMVDDGLDTGDVIGVDTVAIHPKDTPATLRKKLDRCGAELLKRCVGEWKEGRCLGQPQPHSKIKAKRSPTRRQRLALEAKLRVDAGQTGGWESILKTAYYLVLFYGGIFHLVRAWRKLARRSRACILLYHRVNNLSEDPLTTNVERFAEQMTVIGQYYSVVPTSSLVEALKTGQALPRHAIAIHFDDCYRDVFTNALPILAQKDFRACFFVSSGYVGTDRVFPHDAEKCPFKMENLTVDDLRGLVRCGFEIAAHTVSHPDLGQCSFPEAVVEVEQPKEDLARFLGQPITYFSYPFGERKNIQPFVIDLIRDAGYDALFSAYGGYVNQKSDLFDLPRWSVSSRFRPLDLLMEIEGLSIAATRRWWHNLVSQPNSVTAQAVHNHLGEPKRLLGSRGR